MDDLDGDEFSGFHAGSVQIACCHRRFLGLQTRHRWNSLSMQSPSCLLLFAFHNMQENKAALSTVPKLLDGNTCILEKQLHVRLTGSVSLMSNASQGSRISLQEFTLCSQNMKDMINTFNIGLIVYNDDSATYSHRS